MSDNLRLASVYIGIGMKESSYECLRYFFSKPISKKMHFVWIKYLDIDRNFDRVRGEEEFIRIAKK